MTELRNWAGNYQYHFQRLHKPETLTQLQELVASSQRLKVLGSRHSFNSIADTTAEMISLEHWDRVVHLDRERQTVTVQGGIKYGPLCQYLHAEGFALHNLASLPHISVVGACSTATHGSGVGNGNLATAVCAMQMVMASGEVKTLSEEERGEEFLGSVVGLGALGVVTELTLKLVPTFQVRQDVYLNLPLAQLESHFEEIVASAYSVSLFTGWRDERIEQVWLKSRIEESTPPVAAPTFFGATPATRRMHPIASVNAESCTEQGGIPGAWQDRLPHFRMEFTPSHGEELQSEYFVPRKHAVEALRAVFGLGELLAPLLQISEIRTIAADNLWLSPCYHQDCIGLHFTWIRDWERVQKVLQKLEESLAPFQALPHWGKLFALSPAEVEAVYTKLPDFRRLLHASDPEGKLHNAFLETYVLRA
jgi:xylitol oxidase